MTGDNPFASPEADARSDAAPTELEAIRLRLLPFETVLRAAAVLYYFEALIALVLAAALALDSQRILDLTLVALGGFASVAAGIGLRRLARWARPFGLFVGLAVPAVITIVMKVPNDAVPIVSLTVPAALLLVLKPIGWLFTYDYATAREATPYLRYKAPKAVWIAFLVLLLALAAVLVPMLVRV